MKKSKIEKKRLRQKRLAENAKRERPRFPGRVVRPDRGMFAEFRSTYADHQSERVFEVTERNLPIVPSYTKDVEVLTQTEAKSVVWNVGYKPAKNPNSRTPLGQKVAYQQQKGHEKGLKSDYHDPIHGVSNPRYDQ